jgi:hypothetical protein
MEAHSLGINTTDKYHAFPRGSCSLSILPTLTISIINHYNNTMNQHLVFGPPPSQTSFPDISTALKHCQDHARDLGYSVVLRSTVKDLLGSPFRSYFACDRGGVYRDRTKPSAKPRKKRSEDGVLDGTASRKTNCPFQLRLDINENKTWKLIVNQLAHNHLPSLNASAHPSLRRRDLEKHQDEIKRSYNAGESTRTIITKLRELRAKARPRDIYNFGQRIRLESLGGLTPIQWLKEELDRQGYYNKIDFNKTTNKVTRLFYMHPTAIKLWKLSPDCLLLDCTYKTNRFNMPLLNVCGVTGNNRTPQFALCFLSSEKEEDYQWALRQLRNCIVSFISREELQMED